PGKEVVEFAVVHTSKGAAIEALSRASAADAWLYLGDDVTDESVFAQLGSDDVGVKVGGGDTAAGLRVQDPAAARALLRRVPELRGPIPRRPDAAQARASAQQRGVPGQPASQAADRGFFRCPRQDSNLRASAREADALSTELRGRTWEV